MSDQPLKASEIIRFLERVLIEVRPPDMKMPIPLYMEASDLMFRLKGIRGETMTVSAKDVEP